MGRSDFLFSRFISFFRHEPTPCQVDMLRKAAEFIGSDDDIMIVNGYAGTGKTTAIASVIAALKEFRTKSVLLAPTGRSAKVLSSYTGQPAFTIHKHIYRQKSVGGDGFGQFTLAPNKDKDTLFIVDEVSLISIDAGQQQSTTTFGTGNLLEDLITFVRSGVGCKLVMIGDSAQLPPIGLDASPALSKEYMTMMGGTVFASLETVVRQQKESGILYNATMIRQLQTELDYGPGVMDICDLGLETSRFDDIERIGGGELIEKISDAYAMYGEDDTIILCRSNKRAIKYNMGIRATVQFKEERLVRDDKLMIVKNCYQFLDGIEGMDYIANGDIAKLQKISKFEDRYGLHFAEARISFPDYDDQEIVAKVILDTLESESASLTYEQSNLLYQGVNEDYAHIKTKKKRYEAVREDKYYNALQLKYANAITCHKSQGGQWRCVFIDNPIWREDMTADDLKWLYTAITRATEKVYLVNFKDELFAD